jgi:small subunit ribosomal protein S3Ae
MVRRVKKGKKWYVVVAPEMFGRTVVGEIPGDSPEKLLGRNIEITLGELTSDASKQHTKLIFQVKEVDGDTASTKFLGHRLSRDYLRSLVKRKTSKIDVISTVETRDGSKVGVKSSCFTVKRAKERQAKAIREIMKDVIESRASSLTLSQYIQEIVLGKLAADIYKDAKRVYPLRRVEIESTKVYQIGSSQSM